MNNEQEIRLQGRRVLVTGAARGLGAAFARALPVQKYLVCNGGSRRTD